MEKCYKIAGLTDDTRKNFTEAITACQQMLPPAKLASIHNYIEQSTCFALFFLFFFMWLEFDVVECETLPQVNCVLTAKCLVDKC